MTAHNKLKNMLYNTAASTNTSPWVFIGDCRVASLSIQTQVAGASNVTISLSNDDGFNSAIQNKSVVTVMPSPGVFTLDPGARWVQAERASASTTTVLLSRYYE